MHLPGDFTAAIQFVAMLFAIASHGLTLGRTLLGWLVTDRPALPPKPATPKPPVTKPRRRRRR